MTIRRGGGERDRKTKKQKIKLWNFFIYVNWPENDVSQDKYDRSYFNNCKARQ